MKTIITILLVIISVAVFGQAHEGTVNLIKKQHPAAVIELAYEPHVVGDALKAYNLKMGNTKAGDVKDFSVYHNMQENSYGINNADLYFKLERKSRKEKNSTVLSLMILQDDGTRGKVYVQNMQESIAWLNRFLPSLVAFNLEIAIRDQNTDLAKAESKYNGMMNDGNELEKKRIEIEKKIEENKSAQLAQMKLIEIEKQKLAAKTAERRD